MSTKTSPLEPENPTVARRLLEACKKSLELAIYIGRFQLPKVDDDRLVRIRNILKMDISWAESQLANAKPKVLEFEIYKGTDYFGCDVEIAGTTLSFMVDTVEHAKMDANAIAELLGFEAKVGKK